MILLLVCSLVLAACSDTASPTTSQATAPVTSTTVTATTPPATNASVVTVPTPTLASGSVGDPAAIAEAHESALRGIRLSPESFPPGAIDIDIPWPDTTNPDPVVALRSIWEFDAWVATTLPYDRLAMLYLAEDSSAWDRAGEFIEELDQKQWMVEFDGPGFVWKEGAVVEAGDSLELPELPIDSIVIRYRSSQSDARILRLGDGSEVSSGKGYEEQSRIAVLVPTDLGWQIYWFGES